MVVCIRIVPTGSYTGVLSQQRMALFERIKRIRRCGLVGGNVSTEVGFEVSKAHAKTSFMLSLDLWIRILLL